MRASVLRYGLLIGAFFVLSTSVWAQREREQIRELTRRGDSYTNTADYFLAAEAYAEALALDESNSNLRWKLANTYYAYSDYESAKVEFRKLFEQDEADFPLARFYYAVLLMFDGRYQESLEQFVILKEIYKPTGSTDHIPDLIRLYTENVQFAIEESKKPLRQIEYSLLPTPVNSEFSDFGAVFWEHDSSIVITSARKENEGDRTYGRLGGGFTDNLRFRKTESGWEEVPPGDQKFEKLNTKYNDGAGVFNAAKDKYYFTICDEENKQTGDLNCAIYVSRLEGGEWSKAEKLNKNINSPGDWNAQPSLNFAGDTMYFVSKREGGYGFHDIYYSVNGGGENWGKPVNLGENVNTAYYDLSPCYYAKEGILLFSSSGRQGFGGMDIFMARGKNFEEVTNIGLPFNSSMDDFYFVLGEKRGYLTSNRAGGIGNDDIYVFNIESKESLIALIDKDSLGTEELISLRGRLLDDDGTPAEDLVVLLRDAETGELIARTTSDPLGEYQFDSLPPTRSYEVLLQDGTVITEPNEITAEPIEIFLTNPNKIREAGIDPELLDPKDPRPKDPVGKDPVVKDPVAKDPTVATNTSPKNQGRGRILFEHIYFDFDKDVLRPEAKKILDAVGSYLRDHPEVTLEIQANTDSYGSNEYNVGLAQRRGSAAQKYLRKAGLSTDRMRVVPQGEVKPIATNQNPIGRQLNRRVEFYVLGAGRTHEPEAMIYVVEPNSNLNQIAGRFNMSVEELRRLNDLPSAEVVAYQPLRVRRTGDADIISPVTLQYVGGTRKSGNNPTVQSGGPDPMAMFAPRSLSAIDGQVFFDDPYNQNVKYKEKDGTGYTTVLPRNTLYSIAKIHGTTPEELRKLNNLKNDRIYFGQRLRVRKDVAAVPSGYDNSDDIPNVGITISEQYGQIVQIGTTTRYVVKGGDTFYSIAKRFKMDFEQLRLLNHLPNYQLRIGMVLKVNLPEGGVEEDPAED